MTTETPPEYVDADPLVNDPVVLRDALRLTVRERDAAKAEVERLKRAYRAMGDAAKALQAERDTAREAATIVQRALQQSESRNGVLRAQVGDVQNLYAQTLRERNALQAKLDAVAEALGAR